MRIAVDAMGGDFAPAEIVKGAVEAAKGLPCVTKLLLVGDPDQLASVEAGSVLADIARAAGRKESPLAAVTDRLVVRHRFGAEIGGLADAILAGDPNAVLRLLRALGVELVLRKAATGH